MSVARVMNADNSSSRLILAKRAQDLVLLAVKCSLSVALSSRVTASFPVHAIRAPGLGNHAVYLPLVARTIHATAIFRVHAARSIVLYLATAANI